jgi:SAM-dependent methyltransferase
MDEQDIKNVVRTGYGEIARKGGSCCSPSASCCGTPATGERISRAIGYSADEIGSVPGGADLGLGCGNPLALIGLKGGETVLDLGSGAGFDCFLAAQRVGRQGRVIGVDMTPEMIERARENASRGKYGNVEFHLGEIEHLPVADKEVDLVISNCVINLVPDKIRAFREAFRVLKPGGRLMVSDIVLTGKLPEAVRNSLGAYVGCLSGAISREAYLAAIAEAGFADIIIVEEKSFPVRCMLNDPTVKNVLDQLAFTPDLAHDVDGLVRSVKVSARRE